MAQILPRDLTAIPGGVINPAAAIIVDNEDGVFKGTPANVVDAGAPINTQGQAEAGLVNTGRMTPLRTAQAIAALGLSQAVLAAPTGGEMVGFGDSTVGDTLTAQAAAIDGLGDDVSAIDPRLSAQNLRFLTSVISAKLPELRVWDVNGYGPGGVNHNFDALDSFRNLFGGSMGGTGDPINDRYVDWVAGSDSNNGRGATPYKTLQKALENATGEIWILADSEEVLDFDGTDRTAGGGTITRAMAVRGYNGRKTFYGAGLKASAVTWTDTSVSLSTVWKFTNTPGARVESIIYAADGNWKNGVIVPFRGTATDDADAKTKAGANFDGWSQISTNGDIYLRYFSNMNIQAQKAKFFIAYAATPHRIRGGVLYFEDVDFLGGGGLNLLDSAVTPSTFKSTVFLRNCDVMFSSVAGLDPDDDSFIAAQNCRISRNSGDGVGSHGNSVTLLVDSWANFNGSVRNYYGVTNPARNRQGLSTHEDSFAMAIASDFQNNYGQNCANTTTTSTTITTHVIGCDFRNPWQGDGVRNNVISGYTCLETYGKAYVDTCLTGGAMSSIGWVKGGGTAYGYRNQLQGTTAASSAGILLYDPFGTLP